ncbi:MAG TPA: 16S rRNA (uracil(1498)-N(3))-methyltransferase [Bacteroidetes bacterium]|nr:16S rRNA (uracil(1498)-N(3))-methyltransferase [Bacteroidota bacterium]
MQLFYSNKLEAGIFTFDVNESKHIIKVLRHRTGDTVYVTNGRGTVYEAGIINDDPLQCRAEIRGTMPSFDKHDYYLHIAIAPTKNSDRMEWFVEKAVELGIDEISPLVCEHSERRKINKDRLQKITVSAMKQSFKSHLAKINDIVSFPDFVKREFKGKKFIAHLDSEITGNKLAVNYLKGENALFLIGPEGDFSREEIDLAIRNDYLPLSLGNSRLRTETAGLTACCWVYFINQ